MQVYCVIALIQCESENVSGVAQGDVKVQADLRTSVAKVCAPAARALLIGLHWQVSAIEHHHGFHAAAAEELDSRHAEGDIPAHSDALKALQMFIATPQHVTA